MPVADQPNIVSSEILDRAINHHGNQNPLSVLKQRLTNLVWIRHPPPNPINDA